jgi:4-hydroxyphenylpyruvate dioxygenase
VPRLPEHTGIEFVAFAVDAPAYEELGGFLGGLGFARTGLHRSKDVALWRNDGTNLVLNAEPDSAAAEPFEQHGPTVCALALRVNDPQRVVARAEALLYPTWRERPGAGERHIPAIRQPDGTLLYLVEDPAKGARPIWEDDFQLMPVEDGPAPMQGIDHAAEAVAPGMMDSFVLFYCCLLGLQPETLWELPDPYGLVRSRAFVASNGSLRLPLNVSESTHTGTGRFVSALAGAGVHHIAFAVTDAAATAETAAARSAPLLEIPENYHEDLATRLGLSDQELAALQRCNVLYDRDAAGGVFRHAYTHQFRDRIFLEIAQRRGGYTGFGAVNAPVRMAAQRRQPRLAAARHAARV